MPEADTFLREGRWQQNQSMVFMGSRLHGKALVIVGMGPNRTAGRPQSRRLRGDGYAHG
ncbi:MAG: hypothetical protein HOE85_16420 [Nitrospinaceae bacterium]|nr:hypothetical protein [Nitrospinaceae bacterium]MBT3820434.1 hypothetical protein [Nitrospinaceae bacterium]MBT4095548.1 hypothetical protein [Nitrospinaceae bacterium]